MEDNIKIILEEIVSLLNNLEIRGNNNVVIVSNILMRINSIVGIISRGEVIDNTKEEKNK